MTAIGHFNRLTANRREIDVTAPGVLPIVSASMGEAVHLVRCSPPLATRSLANLELIDLARAYQVNTDSPNYSRLNRSTEDTNCRRCRGQ